MNISRWLVAAATAVVSSLCQAAPANDNLANAIVVSVGTTSGDNTGATVEQGENGLHNATVWFAFTPTKSGVYLIDDNGTDNSGGIDAMLSIYTSSKETPTFDSLTALVETQDTTVDESYYLVATAGTTYYICWDGYSDSRGSFEMHITKTDINAGPWFVAPGASGSGSSVDDPTGDLTNAMEKVLSGQTINLAPGEYNITNFYNKIEVVQGGAVSLLEFRCENVTLKGAGPDKTKIVVPDGCFGLRMGKNGSAVRDLTIMAYGSRIPEHVESFGKAGAGVLYADADAGICVSNVAIYSERESGSKPSFSVRGWLNYKVWNLAVIAPNCSTPVGLYTLDGCLVYNMTVVGRSELDCPAVRIDIGQYVNNNAEGGCLHDCLLVNTYKPFAIGKNSIVSMSNCVYYGCQAQGSIDSPAKVKESGCFYRDSVADNPALKTVDGFIATAVNPAYADIGWHSVLDPSYMFNTVTVVGGSTTNNVAEAGTTVTILANDPEPGCAFAEWTCDVAVTFDNARSVETTFTMPMIDVSVSALFAPIVVTGVAEEGYPYVGLRVKPEVAVFLDGVDISLVRDVDYAVTYADNDRPGTATLTVEMLPPRKGRKSTTFKIIDSPPARGEHVVSTDRFASFSMDTREGPFESDGKESLAFSVLWHGDTNSTAMVSQDGTPVSQELSGEGECAWRAPSNGVYTLTLSTVSNGVVVATEDAVFVVSGIFADLSAEIGWKHLQATGTYFAQIQVVCTNGFSAGVENLRYLFADRVGADGKTEAALWRTPLRAANPVTEERDGEVFRVVPLDASLLTAENVPAVYGVLDLAAESLPVAERTIEMYVRRRVVPEEGNEGAARVGDFVGYLCWTSDGQTFALPVVADGSPLHSQLVGLYPLHAPLSVSRLNDSLAVGAPLAEGSNPYCDIVEFNAPGDNISGKVEVGAASGEEKKGAPPPEGVSVTLLGAATPTGPFEEVAVVGVGPDGSFSLPKPVGARFFKLRVDAAERAK